MNDLLLKNVVIHDGEQTDILINDGYIKKSAQGRMSKLRKKFWMEKDIMRFPDL